jgi:hypothetical protein
MEFIANKPACLAQDEDIAARSAVRTLISGSCATDVEWAARRIHAASSRAPRILIEVSAGAVPSDPVELQKVRASLIEAAPGGTAAPHRGRGHGRHGSGSTPRNAYAASGPGDSEFRRPYDVSHNRTAPRARRARYFFRPPVLSFERDSCGPRGWSDGMSRWVALGPLELTCAFFSTSGATHGRQD